MANLICKCFQIQVPLLIFAIGSTDSGIFPIPRILKDHLPALPSPTQFLSMVLNVTADKVSDSVEAFAFSEKTVSANDIKILFYKEGGNYNLYRLDSSNIIEVDPDQDIKIIIHGFRSSGYVDWAKEMAMAYHKLGIRNIISIDWNDIADEGYFKAATSTKCLGTRIADWLFYTLLQADPSILKSVHLIGHSLGAHVSGYVGKRISKITDGRHLIGRISGLDAAAPLFEFPVKLDSDLRLNDRDADVVEGFHTNVGFFGVINEFAHRDFYITYGGPIQPGCINGLNILDTLTCSHGLSHEIFTKAIGSTAYLATECSNRFLKLSHLCRNNQKVIMGEHSNATSLRGSFYLNIDKNWNPLGNQLPEITSALGFG